LLTPPHAGWVGVGRCPTARTSAAGAALAAVVGAVARRDRAAAASLPWASGLAAVARSPGRGNRCWRRAALRVARAGAGPAVGRAAAPDRPAARARPGGRSARLRPG